MCVAPVASNASELFFSHDHYVRPILKYEYLRRVDIDLAVNRLHHNGKPFC